MVLTSTQQNEVTKLAVTLFGAAPGGYKAYLNGVYSENGHNMEATALVLGNEPVFATMYSGTHAQNVDKILNNLSVDAISNGALKAIAVNYITDQVNSGASIAELYAFALDYMANNVGFDEALAVIDKKVAVANSFTSGAGKGEMDLNFLIAKVANVTVDTEVGESDNLMTTGSIMYSDGEAPSEARAVWEVNAATEADIADDIGGVTAAVIATAITAATAADDAVAVAVIATQTALESKAVADAIIAADAAAAASDAAAAAESALFEAAVTAALAAGKRDNPTVTATTATALENAAEAAKAAAETAALAAEHAAAAVDATDPMALIFAEVGAKATADKTAATLGFIEGVDSGEVMSEAEVSQLLYKATLTVTFSDGTGSAESLVNGFESSVVIPTVNYLGSKSDVNQAIKTAINNDAVLSKLLTVQDGPADSLIIHSLVHGVFEADDLELSIVPATLTDLSTAEQAGLNLAWQSLNDGLTTPALTQSDLDAAATNVLAGSGDGAMALAFTGNASTVESNNSIAMDVGDSVIVLSSQANSNEVLVFDGAFGNDTVFNFNDGLVTLTGADVLDFSAHLNNAVSATAQTSALWSATQTLDAGDFAVITDTVFTAVDSWAGMTSIDFLQAVQNEADVALNYAGIDDATLEAGVEANTVDSSSNSIVFVENTGNLGEYKVFEMVSDNATTEFTAATLLGSIDFGASIDVAAVTIA